MTRYSIVKVDAKGLRAPEMIANCANDAEALMLAQRMTDAVYLTAEVWKATQPIGVARGMVARDVTEIGKAWSKPPASAQE